MRVLIVNQTFYPDVAATAQHAHDLARHLVGAGCQVEAIASRSIYGQRGAVLAKRECVEGIEIRRVGVSLFGKGSLAARAADFLLFHVLALGAALRAKRADVCVCLTTPPFIAVVGWVLKLLRRTKFVYWVMDLYPDVPVACGVMRERSWLVRMLEGFHRFLMRRADRVVVLGRCMQERVLAKGIEREKVVVINVWADREEVRPMPAEEVVYRREWGLEGKFVVMYSGNFGLGHETETICGAMERLAERQEIRFVFVGGGKRMEEVRRFAEGRGLKNVQFHPYQKREHLGQLLSCGDVHLISMREEMAGLIVPSKFYGVLAAGRAGILIGPENSEIGRALKESGAGFVVRCGDVEGLVAAVEGLAKDAGLRGQMGQRARAVLEEKYDRAIACAKWQRLLEEVVRG